MLSAALPRDVNTIAAGLQPNGLVASGSSLYFIGNDGVHGTELWKSNGTSAGTKLLKDIAPGPASGAGSSVGATTTLVDVNGKLFFVANDGVHGKELWKSDGTAAGTAMVKDVTPGSSGSGIFNFFNAGGTLYFAGPDSLGGSSALWKSDGTAAGTFMVKAFNSGLSPSPSAYANGTMFFTVQDGVHGTELWKSDGTTAGTVMVKDVRPGSLSGVIGTPVAMNGTIYFAGNDGAHGTELWKSDGTDAGTVMVKDINVIPGSGNSSPSALFNIGGTLLFAANDGLRGTELWKSDGTAAGTVLVKDVFAGATGGVTGALAAVSGGLYFWATDGTHGVEPWFSDGTTAGTRLVRDVRPGTASSRPTTAQSVSQALNGTVYFNADDGIAGVELWKTNGTDTGTVRVADISPGAASSDLRGPTALGGNLYFRTSTAAAGAQLWRTDGTTGATAALTSVTGGTSDGTPNYLVPVGNRVFFQANDGVNTVSLWASDGTAAGTVLLKDVPDDPNAEAGVIADVNGVAFFPLADATNGRELWKSDGTAAGTVLVKDINPGAGYGAGTSMTGLNGVLILQATDGSSGSELWKSDGTAAGTVLVKDINPGIAGSNPTTFVSAGGVLYFVANDGTNGSELWRTDGTAAGTVLVKDINPGSAGSGATSLVAVGNTLYFLADDGVHGSELWRSDGTTAGTVLVKDLGPGSAGSGIYWLTAAGSRLYFLYPDGVGGDDLWTSDGTDAGTTIVKAFGQSTSVSEMRGAGGSLYFIIRDGTTGLIKQQVWKTDGTVAGTALVKEFKPGSTSPTYLTDVNGTLYFAADDGVSGIELWKSDGTAAGTVLAADVDPGPGSSSPGTNTPGGLTNVNGRVYFSASDGVHGRELWTYVPDPAGPSALSADANFAGRVELSWIDNTADETEFAVERSGDGGLTFVQVGTAPAKTGTGLFTTYTDPNLPTGRRFVYRVRALRGSQPPSAYSDTAEATTLDAGELYANTFQAPGRPASGGVTVPGPEWQQIWDGSGPPGGVISRLKLTSAVADPNQRFIGMFSDFRTHLQIDNVPAHDGITVAFDVYTTGAWPAGANLAVSFFPNSNGDPQFQQLLNLGFDTGASADGVFHFSKAFAHSDTTAPLLLAFHMTGLYGHPDALWGLDNVHVSVTPDGATDLTATAAPDGPIRLRWVDGSDREAGYQVYRRTDGTSLAPIGGVLAPDTTAFLDTAVEPGRKYYYKVAPVRTSGLAAFSNEATATSVPAGMTYTSVGTVTIPVGATGLADSPAVTTPFVLEAGVHYQLVASGNFHLGGKYGRADAEFSYPDSSSLFSDKPNNSYITDVDYGIGVNDPVKDQNKYPTWAPAYAGSHVYVVNLVGDGRPLTLDYHDDYFADNQLDSGDLTVEVLRGWGGVNLPPTIDSKPPTSFDILTVAPPTLTGTPLPSMNPAKASVHGQAFYDADNDGVRAHTTSSNTALQLQPHNADTVEMPWGDDEVYDPKNRPQQRQPLGFSFDFFGNSYDTLFVNINGNVTFNAGFGSFVAQGFPVGGDDVSKRGQPMIAPFWTDVDTNGGEAGTISFTTGVDQTGHRFAQIDWDQVGRYQRRNDKRDTFSLYIQDDPTGDNVAFFYGDMQWTTADYPSGGVDGFGGDRAQVGFDAGDGVHFVSEGRPNTPEALAAFANKTFVYKIRPDGYPVQYLETGADGVTVDLLDAAQHVVASQVTRSYDLDGDGYIDPIREQGLFQFNDLPAGKYFVRQAPSAPWAQTFPLLPQFELDLTTGQHLDGVQFGDRREYSYAIQAFDPNGDALTYTLTDGPAGARLSEKDALGNPEHRVTWLPSGPGKYPFAVEVRDPAGLTDTQDWNLQVNTRDPNVNPSIGSAPQSTARRTRLWSYAVEAVDPNRTDTLTYELVTHPEGMTIDPVTHVITWTPQTLVSPQEVSLRVTDGRGGVATQHFTVSVVEPPPNDPPVVYAIPPQQVTPGQEFRYVVRAEDPEDGKRGLSYQLISVVPATDAMQIEGAGGGILGWTPTAADVGTTRTVTVGVVDEDGGATQVQFTVTVVPVRPAKPSGLKGVSGPSGIHLDWADNTEVGLLGYRVYKQDPASRQWVELTGGQPTPYSYFDDAPPATPTTLTYRVTAVGADGTESDYAQTDVRPDSSGVTPPDGVKADAISSTRIYVSWVYDPGITRYVVWRTDTSTPGQETRIPPDGGVDQLTFIEPKFEGDQYYLVDGLDQPLAPGHTYSYSISAVVILNNVPYESPRSMVAMAKTFDALPKPTGLVVTAPAGTHVHLAWDAGTEGASGAWDILRATSADGPFEPLLPQGTVAGTPEYDDQSAEPDTHYWYQVRAVRSAGGTLDYSAPSDAADVTTPHGAGIPLAPTGLRAGYAGQGRVGLAWSYVLDPDLLGFDVYRSTDQNFLPSAATLIGSSDAPRYTDDGLDGDRAGVYYYRVIAVRLADGGDGEVFSAPSAVASVNTANGPAAPPEAPDQLRATEVAGDHVSLSWQDNSVTETEFDVYRRPAGATNWDLVGRVTADATSLLDGTVEPSSNYQYSVVAHNAAGDNRSEVIDVSTPNVGPAPLAPTNLSVVPGSLQYDRVTLTWDAVQGGEPVVGYHVYRRTAATGGTPAGPFVRLDAAPVQGGGGTITYSDVGLAPSTAYEYYVTSVTGQKHQSAPSNVPPLLVPTPAAPASPPNVRIVSPTDFTGVAVDWTAPSDAEGGVSDGRIRQLTKIRAIVDDPTGAGTSWSLFLRPVNADDGTTSASPEDILVASGSGRVGSLRDGSGAVIASLDPSLYPSGDYDLVLTASNTAGAAEPQTVRVSLYSDVKLGNLELPFTDLQVDVPGGTPITVTRVYDSSRADVPGDFGYGWRLATSDANLRTTAEPGPGDSPDDHTLHPGDLVYVTVPGGGQHTFQFWPSPESYDPNKSDLGQNPYFAGYQAGSFGAWVAQFVCVDGSDAKLAVEGDINDTLPGEDDEPDWIMLAYDQDTRKLSVSDVERTDLQGRGYDPAALGLNYTLSTPDGATYDIDSGSGRITQATDPNGNVTTYSPGAIGSTAAGLHLAIDRTGPGNTIKSIQVVDAAGNTIGAPVTYKVDPQTLDLRSVTDRAGVKTTFGYNAGRPHFVSEVYDGTGLRTLAADYDKLGRLKTLTDAHGRPAAVGAGGLDASGAHGTVSDLSPAQNTTESIYDDHGDVVREIRSIKDDAGIVTGYSITVREFDYYTGDLVQELGDIFRSKGDDRIRLGASSQNSLSAMREWQTFELPGPDIDGLRYEAQPTTLARELKFDQTVVDGVPGPGFGFPSVETVYLAGGDRRVTTYTDYAHGEAGTVSVSLVHANGSSTVLSSTSNAYDANGNLDYTLNQDGLGTEYVYTKADDGVPVGLLKATYRVVDDDGNSATRPIRVLTTADTSTDYYPGTDIGAGQFYGKVKSSTSGKQKTYFSYDAEGRVTRTYTLWFNPESGGANRWVVSTNFYDAAGRVTSTTEAVYVDAGTPEVPDIDTAGAPDLNGNRPLAEPVYTAGQKTTETHYDALGRVDWSEDAFGARTSTTFDARGNAIRTVGPDGTETRTVYDEMGRVIWATEAFKPLNPNNLNNPADTVILVHTTYDSLGRAVKTERFRDGWISLTSEDLPGIDPVTGKVSFMHSALGASGTLVSATSNVYDEQGRVVESVAANGLRTGTVYYADSRVHYTGLLLPEAPATWYEQADPLSFFRSQDGQKLVTTTAYDLVDSKTGQLYDTVTDTLGQVTSTYHDLPNGASRTVYDDGTLSETFQGVNGHVVTALTRDDQAIPVPPALLVMLGDGVTTFGDGQHVGWRDEVRIAQRAEYDAGDPTNPDARVLATHYLYDDQGRLRDVWLPAVENAANADAVEWPHWSYAYDDNDNQKSQTDPNGHTTFFTYDEHGRRTGRTLPGDEHESWTYDALGRLVTHVDFKNQTTAYGYGTTAGTMDRVENEYRFRVGVVAVDGSGNIVTASAAERTEYVFDALGRVETTREYIGNGRVRETTSAVDPVTGAVTRVTEKRADTPGGTLAVESIVNHAYDPITGLLTATWTGDTTDVDSATTATLYGYDDQGRLLSVTSHRVNGAAPTAMAAARDYYDATGHVHGQTTEPTTLYAYDALGNLDAVLLPDGVTSDYQYDDLNRLTHLDQFVDANGNQRLDAGETVQARYSYHLNADGTRKDATEVDDQGHTTTLNWRYDADGRLVAETRDASDPVGDDYIATYAYDLNGNRLKYRIIDDPTSADIAAFLSPTPPTFNADRTITYEYNEDDQLWRETGTGTDAYLTLYGHFDPQDANVFHKGYDPNGSLVEKVRTGDGAESDSYAYDLKNRMTSATVGGQAMTFEYDSDGNRVRRSDPTATTVYVNDAANPSGYTQVIEEHAANADGTTGALSTTYVVGNDVIGQARAANATTPYALEYVLYDGHGNTRELLATDATTVQRYSYDAFGLMLDASPTPQLTSILYAGEEYDSGLAMGYLRARYYDQTTGRFSSFDTYEAAGVDPSLLHKYLFVHNDPINFVDPSGHDGLIDVLTVIGIRAIGFARTAWPTVQAVLVIRDVATIAQIIVKGVTQGRSAVTDEDESNLKWALAGLAFAGLGGVIAKGILGAVLHLPLGESITSFKGVVNAVNAVKAAGAGEKLTKLTVDLSRMEEVGRTSEGLVSIGRFRLNNMGQPVITIFKNGDNVRTVLHEYLHYIRWVLNGRPTTKAAWEAFEAAEKAFEYGGRGTGIFDEFADLILRIAQGR